MKRFRFCSCGLVCMSLLMLLVWGLLIPATATADPNPACTQGCGPPNGVCYGSDSNGCYICVTNGNCGGQSGMVTWYNTTTRGSTMGSQQISWNPVNCRQTWPCVAAYTHTDRQCFMDGWHRDGNGCRCGTGTTCEDCALGAGTMFNYSSCTEGGCPEL